MFINIISLGIYIQTFLSSVPGDIKEIHAQKNFVSITFDDGPHKEYTPDILSILKERKVYATFFVVGNRIHGNKQILQKMILEGHTIGNHSYSHANMKSLGIISMAKEFYITQILIFFNTLSVPKYFRFPYGYEDRRLGYFYKGAIAGWNVDAYDWKAKDPHILAKMIVNQTKTGSIILLHDIKKDTVLALPEIIDGIRAKGFEFEPLSKMLPMKKEVKNPIYRSASQISGLGSIPEKKKNLYNGKTIITTEIANW